MSKIGDLIRPWLRQAQRVFHLLVALVFLFFAAAGGFVSFTEWRQYAQNHEIGLAPFGLVVGFTVLLIILSLYSLAKARSVR